MWVGKTYGEIYANFYLLKMTITIRCLLPGGMKLAVLLNLGCELDGIISQVRSRLLGTLMRDCLHLVI